MRNFLGRIYEVMLSLNAGFNDLGQPEPQIVVRSKADGRTEIFLWSQPETIIIPPGQEMAVTIQFANPQAIKLTIDRWDRYGTT